MAKTMHLLFIEARRKCVVKLDEEDIKKLPKKIALFATVQYLNSLEAIKKQLNSYGKKALVKKLRHSKYKGQILGCNADFDERLQFADCFLIVGDGDFHSLGIPSQKPVFCLGPDGRLRRLDNSHNEKIKRRRIAALTSFLHSQKIGILVSTKPGQNMLKQAEALKSKLQQEGKRAYVFFFDTLDFEQLNNFPFVQSWVNTACPRIAYDDYEKFSKPVINVSDIINYAEVCKK
ncbi:MAG: diphthamide synthesis protein [Candidatus Woesearchaeota archaeon]